MTWIQVAEHLSDSIFEQALIDGVFDMCFLEGEDTIKAVEDYLNAIDSDTNTAESDQAILDRVVPYFENSFLVYGRYLLSEGEIKPGGGQFVTGASATKAKQASGVVGAEVSGLQNQHKKAITESDDMSVAGKKTETALGKTGAGANTSIDVNDTGNISNVLMKGEGSYLRNALDIGSAKAKTALEKGGPALAQTHQAGIINKVKAASIVAQKRSGDNLTSVVKTAVSPSS